VVSLLSESVRPVMLVSNVKVYGVRGTGVDVVAAVGTGVLVAAFWHPVAMVNIMQMQRATIIVFFISSPFRTCPFVE